LSKLDLDKLDRLARHLGIPFKDGEFEDEICNCRGEYSVLTPAEAMAMNALPELVTEVSRLRERVKMLEAMSVPRVLEARKIGFDGGGGSENSSEKP